ncbi:hypothetical protein SLS64_010364 [Diaporthe eres]|uniref:FluG domain-containing protein n=1 Tax=Diaporthe eres TaxID=83184 RepID=A0ABR1NY75_DIAER
MANLTNTRNENEALTAEIRTLIKKKRSVDLSLDSANDTVEGFRGQLEALLEEIYVHIRHFGSYLGNAATPDEEILAAWESFLGPINALTAVEPHGHLIAARMTLYLAEAYRQHRQLPARLPMSRSSTEPIALRCNFAISLDDLLLSCLAQIWTQSDKREMFKWVFTDYPVKACRCFFAGGITCQDFAGPGSSVEEYHEQRKRDQVKTACITDPAALTPENGVQPRWRWKRAEGDLTQYPRHQDSFRAGYQESADGESLLMWQDIGSDGPIRESFHYTLVNQDTREEVFRRRAVLRRSRQFILDARKIAECNLARDSERLAQMAMARRSLPAELQVMVFEYLDEIQDHPYIGKLDLSAVYRPFPDISKKCRGCTGCARNAAGRMAKDTCPLKSITIWSLPLRAFHTFHQTSGGDWQLCPHIDCAGHHRDASWQSQSVSVEDHLNSIIQSRCGQGLSIGDIGLGPLDPERLATAGVDRARERWLSSDHRDDDENRDERDEAHWLGIAGLSGVMTHNKTLLDLRACQGSTRRTTADPSWLIGRTRLEEYWARTALAKGHARCEFC